MKVLRNIWETLMFRRKLNLPDNPTIDHAELEEAFKVSEDSRNYARQSLEVARRDLNWLEDGLTPTDNMKRRGENPSWS